MIKVIQFAIGIIILIVIEVFKVYFIMPFPGSQQSETIGIAYFLHQNIFYFRTIGWLMIVFPAFHLLMYGKPWTRYGVVSSIGVYLYIFYMFNFRFQADKMFYQPEKKVLSSASSNKVPGRNLVLGVVINDDARAYPIELIGYHHQVIDTIANNPLMITYCTVCRTGRAYSPIVNGKYESFRLVGMDHFNAMFEDESSGSWWRQVNGEAIAGPMKGKMLNEIPSQQMTLSAWLEIYPHSKILQPDSTFADALKVLKDYDEGKTEGRLEKRDTLSWKEKSWIVGVQSGSISRAYDWNYLQEQRVINDTLNNIPIVISLASDSASFYVFNRDSMTFTLSEDRQHLIDDKTKSTWNFNGRAQAGQLQGKHLEPLQAYQEFWHSWKVFRLKTTQFPAVK